MNKKLYIFGIVQLFQRVGTESDIIHRESDANFLCGAKELCPCDFKTTKIGIAGLCLNRNLVFIRLCKR